MAVVLQSQKGGPDAIQQLRWFDQKRAMKEGYEGASM